MEAAHYFDELNSCHCLFFQELDEPRANGLRLVVKEGRVSKIPVAIEVAGQSLGEGYRVEMDDTCSSFEVTWDTYVRYQITNESFGRAEAGRPIGNAAFYERSSLLDYILKSTIATDEYPGKLLHFQIVCADHIVDVISTSAPECRRTGPELTIN
jgi:hypothetical protein